MLLLATMAMATEVGRSNVFGIGATTGFPFVMVTGKYYFNEKMGLAGYVGTSFNSHDVQVLFQSEILEIHDWDFARFPLYWMAGIEAGLYPWSDFTDGNGLHLGLGVIGGAGVALQFHEVPAEVFAEIGAGGMLLNGCHDYGYGSCLAYGVSHIGGRWYF